MVAPFFTSLPAPETTPPSVIACEPGSDNAAPAPSATLLPRFSGALPSSETLPPMPSVPLPSAPLLPSSRAPAFALSPPLKVLVPFKVSVAAPFLTRLPVPVML